MYPKNIQEYIVESVIKHNKYRDDEIKELQQILHDLDLDKCSTCMKYKKIMDVCALCEKMCCYKCAKTNLKHLITSNTYDEITDTGSCSLDIELCNKCILNLCVECIDSNMCKDCTNKILPHL